MFWCIFAYFQTTRIMSLKMMYFNIWSGYKRVLMHLRILQDHHKLFFKKDIFDHLELLKTCFDAFSYTSRPPESCSYKRYFLTYGLGKDVFWCICTYFCRPPETFFQKRYFLTSGVVKNLFWCICAYSQTTRIMSLKKIFFNIWSG